MKAFFSFIRRVFCAGVLTFLGGICFARARDFYVFEPVHSGWAFSIGIMASICAAKLLTSGGRR